jgi:hypothetical protein
MHGDPRVSGRRLFVFAVLGPCFGLAAAIAIDTANGRGWDRTEQGAIVVFLLFSAVVSEIVRSIDQYFARAVPVPLRAPLVGLVGAMITVGLVLAIFRTMLPFDVLMSLAIAGAACMGTCSLLSDDFRN